MVCYVQSTVPYSCGVGYHPYAHGDSLLFEFTVAHVTTNTIVDSLRSMQASAREYCSGQ